MQITIDIPDSFLKEISFGFLDPEREIKFILASKMIESGKGLYDISISNALEKGEYPATVKYETFSLEGLNQQNGAEVKITLIAE